MLKTDIKYLWAYSASNEWTDSWNKKNIEKRKKAGFDVEGFCVTPKYLNNGTWLTFFELDYLWKTGDKALLRMYSELVKKMNGRNVLILYNGANLHPDFVKKLEIMKIYTVADPECFEKLGKPLSKSFDVVIVNQVAEIERYKDIGHKQVYFVPLGSLNDEEDILGINEETILNPNQRKIDIALICENTAWRKKRVEKLAKAFPNAFLAGNGWPRGFIGWADMWKLYSNSRIGWNIHNTTGFNFRTFELPAFGVMQICDDKKHLGGIFKLGEEVVGYDSIEECIELTKYYLTHPEEQKRIALAGWKRWKKDYTPLKIWEKLTIITEKHFNDYEKPVFISSSEIIADLKEYRKETIIRRVIGRIFLFNVILNIKKKIIKKLYKIDWLKLLVSYFR